MEIVVKIRHAVHPVHAVCPYLFSCGHELQYIAYATSTTEK
jgi:hypothetical protein